MLERDHPTIHEGHCLIRILYAWRNVRIVKWVVERITKNDEAVTMMCAKYTNAAAVESRITITKTSVAVAVAIASRIGIRVTEIDPGFSMMAAGEAVHSLPRRTPGEPDRVLRHAGCDLPLRDKLLLTSRQAGVEITMLGDARFGGGTSAKEKRAGCSNAQQRPREKSTLNHIKIIQGQDNESIVPIP